MKNWACHWGHWHLSASWGMTGQALGVLLSPWHLVIWIGHFSADLIRDNWDD